MTRYKIRQTILVIITLTLAYLGAAQDKDRSALTVPRGPLAMPSGPQESMGIHGHWTVTVRNADGTVASHREFENSITDMGKGVVLSLLTGGSLTNGTPTWQLNISGSLCFQKPSTTLGDCQISVQPTRPIPPGTTNLATVPLEMSGTVKMDGSGQIMSVATQITNVTGKRLPGKTPENITLVFSSRDLTKPDSATGKTSAPINVQAGQNVDFTVDISIS